MSVRELRPALMIFALLSLLTGVLYPLIVTGVAEVLFADQANGSLVQVAGRSVGARLVGQPFSSPRYFWSRPSATSPQPYNGAASSGSNQGPTSPALEEAIKARIAALREADPGDTAPVPIDLVTASGSGLDPHISSAAAEYQVGRVARERGISEDNIRALVREATEGRTFGILGEPRVNVLELNLLLDAERLDEPIR
jgi:K+-transporting ATPase ATPase C chain